MYKVKSTDKLEDVKDNLYHIEPYELECIRLCLTDTMEIMTDGLDNDNCNDLKYVKLLAVGTLLLADLNR